MKLIIKIVGFKIFVRIQYWDLNYVEYTATTMLVVIIGSRIAVSIYSK